MLRIAIDAVLAVALVVEPVAVFVGLVVITAYPQASQDYQHTPLSCISLQRLLRQNCQSQVFFLHIALFLSRPTLLSFFV